MLTRSELLLLVGISDNTLKLRTRRKQIPFVDEASYAASLAAVKDSHGLKRYSDFDALLLFLQEDLARERGVDVKLASNVIENCAGIIIENIEAIRDGVKTVWVGAAFLASGGRMHIGGSIDEIERELKRDIFSDGPREKDVSRLDLVNVNRAITVLRARATDLQIDFNIWPIEGAR